MNRSLLLIAAVLSLACGLAAQQIASNQPSTLRNLPAEAQSRIMNQIAKLTAADGVPGDYMGSAVAINGNTVVVASHSVAGNTGGAAYVFVKPAAGWADMTETAKLTASDGSTNTYFGMAVAISGTTIVVEAGTSGGPSVYVFEEPPTGWTNMTETAKLTTPKSSYGGGALPSVATDGNVVVLGVPWAPYQGRQFHGLAYVFVKAANGWTNTKPRAELFSSDDLDYFGQSVTLRGNVVCVTAGSAGGQSAPVYLYVKPSNGWAGIRSETARLTTSNGDSLYTVAMTSNTILAGAYYATVGSHERQGALYMFVRPASGWANMTETAQLTVSNGQAFDELGRSVAINESGRIVLAGETGRAPNAGALYEFTLPASGWVDMTQTATFLASDPQPGDYLGHSVSISATQMVTGAPQYFSLTRGAAYVFAPPQ